MKGVSRNSFDPNGATSRAMIVSILYRLDGRPEVSAPASFTDVAADSWYADAVAWAEANSLIKGYDGNVFAPNKAISHQEMAAMMYRFAAYQGQDMSATGDISTFPDNGAVAAYAVASMKWAVGTGLLHGSGGKLVPGGTLTRAQAATILTGFLID